MAVRRSRDPRASRGARRAARSERRDLEMEATVLHSLGSVGGRRDTRSRVALDGNTIIANAPDPVFVSDLEGKILQANDAVSQLLGFRQDELVEQSLSRFIGTEEAGAVTA